MSKSVLFITALSECSPGAALGAEELGQGQRALGDTWVYLWWPPCFPPQGTGREGLDPGKASLSNTGCGSFLEEASGPDGWKEEPSLVFKGDTLDSLSPVVLGHLGVGWAALDLVPSHSLHPSPSSLPCKAIHN